MRPVTRVLASARPVPSVALPRLLGLVVLLLAGWTLLAPAALAQAGGYRSTELETIGVELKVPRNYDAIPVDPLEEWVTHQWVFQRKKMREPEKDEWGNEFPEPYLPKIELVWIDYVPDERPTTGGDGGPPPAPGARDERPVVRSKPINSIERYLQRVRGDVFELANPEEQKEIDDDHTATMYELHPGPNARNMTGFKGWCYVIKSPKRTIAFIGTCEEPEYDDHSDVWEEMASSVEFFVPEGKDIEKLRKYYERRPEYIDPEYRIQIISDLVRGWEYKDTENYIFIFRDNLEKSPLLRRLMTDIEAIREVYLELFPPAHPVTAVSTVRICKDLAEYHLYGGPQGSGGYWNSAAEELVFFDYEDTDGKGSGTEDTLIVLYHEAFHQYIYYSTGELAPHSWYNEGTGDYFSGALIKGGKYKKMQVNTWRIEFIQQAIRDKKYVPWREITSYSQAEYYRRAGLCYAQGWSMIYFLRECDDVEDHPVWSQILDIYFNVMKEEFQKGMAEAREGLGEDEEVSQTVKFMIGKESRDKAVEKAFEGVDWFEIEEAWKEFTLGLKVPR